MTKVLEQNEFPCTTCNSADIERAWELMTADKDKTWVAVQIAPAVRVAIGEWFGMARGEDGIGKVVSVLRGIGADVVIDTAVAEDSVTLMEVAKLRERKTQGEKFPLISSRCAAFLQLMKEKYPEVEISDIPTASVLSVDVVKTVCKPQAENKKMYVISVEPCKAAKAQTEADLVLTTEELVQILDETGVNLRLVRKGVLDMPFGAGSGSGYLCGKSGGSAEAVARCLLADKSDAEVRKLAYSGLYSEKARRTIALCDGENEWKIAVVAGLEEAECLLEEVQSGAAEYDYVEIMACSGGCICGDGQDCTPCVGETEGSRAMKLRAVGLKYLDDKRAVKSADRSAAASAVGRVWVTAQSKKALEALEEDAREAVQEAVEETLESQPVEEKPDLKELETEILRIAIGAESDVEDEEGDFEIEFITQEEFDAVGENLENEPELEVEIVEEAPVEEVAEVEEAPVEEVAEVEEAPVEEVAEVEETPVEEVAEVEEIPVEEVAEVEETPVEEVVEVEEAPVEEVAEVEETPVEEVAEVEEAPVEEVAEVEEAPVEEVAEVEEAPVEEVAEVEEAPVEEVAEVEETPVEEVAEVEEAPVEEVAEVEEAPVEEAAEVEEAPVEEVAAMVGGRVSKKDRRKMKRMKKNGKAAEVAKVEETVEETIEDIKEEVIEDAVEDAIEEITEGKVEELVEEIIEKLSGTTEEITEEIVEEVVEEVVEEIVEEVVEEVIEEVVEEIVEEIVEEEIVEEVVEEVAATEEVVEETTETMEEKTEVAEENAKPYYARLSGKDRRKMKRKNKGK